MKTVNRCNSSSISQLKLSFIHENLNTGSEDFRKGSGQQGGVVRDREEGGGGSGAD